LRAGATSLCPDDIAAPNPVPVLDVRDEGYQRSDLFVRKRPVAEFMAWIDDLDPDAGRIDVGDAAPIAPPAMPGALFLIDQLEDLSLLVDQIMGGDLRVRRTSGD
jgi:hypothetical protein